MIHKVSKHKSLDWIDEDSQVQHESMNKNALDSFSAVVATAARTKLAAGQDIETVAQSFGLTAEVLEGILNPGETPKPETKIACACEETPAGDDALEAWAALYGKKVPVEDGVDTRRANSVMSARHGNITDMGGPKKQIKIPTANTIWDSEVIERQAQEKDNGERIREENAAIAKQREENLYASRYSTISGESLADALKDIDTRKEAGVKNMSVYEAHNYSKKLPMNGMSMFDTSDFQRVPDKTAGENAAQVKKTASVKQKPTFENKTVSSKDIFNAMIESMVRSEEDNGTSGTK